MHVVWQVETYYMVYLAILMTLNTFVTINAFRNVGYCYMRYSANGTCNSQEGLLQES